VIAAAPGGEGEERRRPMEESSVPESLMLRRAAAVRLDGRERGGLPGTRSRNREGAM
jgi:hypothetical protein